MQRMRVSKNGVARAASPRRNGREAKRRLKKKKKGAEETKEFVRRKAASPKKKTKKRGGGRARDVALTERARAARGRTGASGRRCPGIVGVNSEEWAFTLGLLGCGWAMPGCRTRRPKRMRAAGPVGRARLRPRAPLCARAAREGMPAMAAMQVRSRRGGRAEGVGRGVKLWASAARARAARPRSRRGWAVRGFWAPPPSNQKKNGGGQGRRGWVWGRAAAGAAAGAAGKRMDSPRPLLSPRATTAHAAALSRGHGPAVPRGVAALERGAARHFCEGVG